MNTLIKSYNFRVIFLMCVCFYFYLILHFRLKVTKFYPVGTRTEQDSHCLNVSSLGEFIPMILTPFHFRILNITNEKKHEIKRLDSSKISSLHSTII